MESILIGSIVDKWLNVDLVYIKYKQALVRVKTV